MVIIPVKNIPILTQFLKENETIFTKYKVKKIKTAIEQGLSKIDLFRTEDNSLYAWVSEEDYLQALESALKVLVRDEEYEYAAKVKQLMDTIQINNLIKETAKTEE